MTVGEHHLDVGAGGIAIGTNATLAVTSGTISNAGDWTNNGTFAAGTGTVAFDGTGQSLEGDTSFNNLTKRITTADTLTFAAGSTTRVTGSLTLQGAEGQWLALRSSQDASAWNIDPQGDRAIAYLDVKDSNNTNGTDIDATGTGSTDSGNNTKWLFDQLPTVTTQAVTDIGASSATGNGTIEALGSSNPTDHGVCWSTSADPTIADTCDQKGAADQTGAFASSLAGLSPSTTYHVRAYATNSGGTAYGEDVTFKTGSGSGAYSLTVTNGNGDGTYAQGREVLVAAEVRLDQDPAQVFVAWTGDTAHLANAALPNTALTMPAANVAITATYQGKPSTQYRLEVVQGSGDGTYDVGQVISIGADPAPEGQVFEQWSGDVGALANAQRASTSVTMPEANVSVSATYRQAPAQTYALTVDGGTGDGDYTAGALVDIAAGPASAGQIFDYWAGDTSTVANRWVPNTTLVMPARATALSAEYREQPQAQVTLTINQLVLSAAQVASRHYQPTAAQRAALQPRAGQTVSAGTWQPLRTSSTSNGNVFLTWFGQTATVENPNRPETRIYMPAQDVAVIALYGPSQGNFTLTVENGSGSGLQAHGSSVAVRANAAPAGQVFDGWSGQTANLDDPSALSTTLYMPAQDVTIRATYRNGSAPVPGGPVTAVPALGLPALGALVVLLGALAAWRQRRNSRH